jgi:excisionase family DNA binding protein
MTINELRKSGRGTISVDEAAALLGIGRNGAFQAVHRGELPVLKLGKRLLVPVEPLLRMLEGDRR